MLRQSFNVAVRRAASTRQLSVPSVMKAAVIRETGDAHALGVESDFPVPSPGAGQVLVNNEYAGINFIGAWPASAACVLEFWGGWLVFRRPRDPARDPA